MNQTLEQHLAFEKLKSVFQNGVVEVKRYGQVEPVGKNHTQYDTPGNLKDWSLDKRKVLCHQ